MLDDIKVSGLFLSLNDTSRINYPFIIRIFYDRNIMFNLLLNNTFYIE